ncbi:MAG: hypothetical protein JL50_15685 [Peptococcaceae bacterium BICA1-7]|nr:MAG: hypothetical protein JL50_15685 [Peptococcaceae bacterium BICA1-7]HBV96769.1 hypothetical protein [Desulfotomaculum sp.]
MSREMATLVAASLEIGRAESLLAKNIKKLDRVERKIFFQEIKPREKEIKQFISQYCSGSEESCREDVIRKTVDSLLEKKGDPDLVDSMVMDVVGRLNIYQSLRERSESEGIRLSAMTSFGGLSMVLFTVVIVTAIVLYFINR